MYIYVIYMYIYVIYIIYIHTYNQCHNQSFLGIMVHIFNEWNGRTLTMVPATVRKFLEFRVSRLA